MRISSQVLGRFDYLWRLFATGLSFALFGLGGTLLSLALLVSVYLAPLHRLKKQLYSRRAISAAFRLYITLLRTLGLLTYEVHGLEHLNKPGQLIIANHPSLLDVVFLISFIKHANCIVKGTLRRNPFTFGPVTAAGFVRNDSGDLIEQCGKSLQRGDSLVIFPEGTRTSPGQPFKLRRGAANIALSVEKNMTPVIIQCQPSTLLKQEKWYTIPKRPPHYTFKVMPEIDVRRFMGDGNPHCLNARHLTDYLNRLFSQHCNPSHWHVEIDTQQADRTPKTQSLR